VQQNLDATVPTKATSLIQRFIRRFIPARFLHTRLFTPAIVPLDLIFFRRIFSNLHRKHGNAKNEVPVGIFQRSVVRLFHVLGMQVDFNAEEYDFDGSGAVGWYEFVTCWKRSKVSVNLCWPERAFLTMEDPGSCLLGQLVSIFITALIFISCICFILGTLPQFRERIEDCPTCEPEQLEVFNALEVGCIVVFTIEYGLRVSLVPFSRSELLDYEKILEFVTEHEDIGIPSRTKRLCRFLMEPMNVIDLLVIIPWYLEHMIGLVGGNLTVLRVLRLTRLFRLVKLGRYFEVLQLILRVFHRSLRALYVLAFYLMLGVCFSSAAMYIVEGGTWDPEVLEYVRTDPDGVVSISPFKSIPHAFWWCIVTCTTTGYGDVVPVTPMGKLVAAATMLVGIMVLAMPISVISLNFSQVWSDWIEERRLEAEAREEDLRSVERALEGMDSRTHLLVEVFDAQPGTSNAEFLGEAEFWELPVDSAGAVSESLVLNLKENPQKKSGGRVSGQIYVSYQWEPEGEEDDEDPSKGSSQSSSLPSQGRLTVNVDRATDLLSSDWKSGGWRDPYVVVHCWPSPPGVSQPDAALSEEYRTRTVPGTLEPVFDETTTFHFRWPADWRPGCDIEPDSPVSSSSRRGEKRGEARKGRDPAVASGDTTPKRRRPGLQDRQAAQIKETAATVEAQGRELQTLSQSVDEMRAVLDRLEASLGLCVATMRPSPIGQALRPVASVAAREVVLPPFTDLPGMPQRDLA